jgi:chromosome segregation ATPase
MTLTRFYLARFAQAFGFFRKAQRLTEAASEMHLLREAEAHLGSRVWENVEAIDELSVEYWNLRKFVKERSTIREKIAECEERLEMAHQERAALLSNAPEVSQELLDERVALLKELEVLANQRDRIVNQAREIRRAYDGMKMKLEVLTKESDESEEHQARVTTVSERLSELKTKFSALKQERLDLGEKIEAGDTKLDLVDQKLNEKKLTRRQDSLEAFQTIGDGNKEISLLRAESAVLSTQMHQLYAEIGRFVSRNVNSSPVCAKAVEGHRGLVDVMAALRKSAALNHKLADNA